MASPCPPNAVKMSVIAGEFGVGLRDVQLSKNLAPFIGKASGSRVAISDFCGASSSYGPDASGGTIQDSNGYRHHIFTSSGEFCINTPGVGSADQTTIHFLAQAGGGGGGSGGYDAREKREFGGGGGGGGQANGTTYIPNAAQCYSIAVGAGGAGASAVELARGGSGGPTSVYRKSDLNAVAVLWGGGGGGSMYNGQWDGVGGGCGGGGGGKYQGTNGTNGGSGTAGQGYRGGAGGSGGAGGGGGTRTNGNTQDFANQAGGSGGGSVKYEPYNTPYGCGGGGAGAFAGGSGYNMGGNGGISIGGNGSATAATREGQAEAAVRWSFKWRRKR